MYNVAVLFRDGIGVDRDEKSAVEWSVFASPLSLCGCVLEKRIVVLLGGSVLGSPAVELFLCPCSTSLRVEFDLQVPQGGRRGLRSGHSRARADEPRGRTGPGQGRGQGHRLVSQHCPSHPSCFLRVV